MDESGSNQNLGEDRPSISPSPLDERRRQILVVEDNKADVFLIRKSMGENQVQADLHVVTDGDAATRFFDRADAEEGSPVPDLVMLDLNLPKKNGEEILKHLRASARCHAARVLIMTSSDSARDRELLTSYAVSEYFRKPSIYSEFMKLGGIARRLLEGS